MKLLPQLANDAELSLLTYPLIVQPKIDGVRAIFFNGKLTGRSLDPFKGYRVAERFSNPEFEGLDGEMIYGNDPASSERLCSLTTGAMSRFKGVTEPAPLSWHVFDLLNEVTINLPYAERYAQLQQRVAKLAHSSIRLVPVKTVNNLAELEAEIAGYAEAGYEGTIIRNPDAQYKEGRPTKKGMELLRVKPWATAEILVTGITEGNANENEATTNSLGRTERSSAQDGMVPNSRVGSIQGTLLADLVHSGGVLPRGLPVTVSKGEMTQVEAAYYWAHPEEIVGHAVTFNTMAHGIKDLPRFPTYVSHRMLEDM